MQSANLSSDEIIAGKWIARNTISKARKEYIDFANEDARKQKKLSSDNIFTPDGKCGKNYVIRGYEYFFIIVQF